MRYPTGHTHLYTILAHPVGHVRASEFINPVFEKVGRDAFLFPFHVLPEDLDQVVRQLVKVRNLKGFIITIPHKPAMAAMCDELGPAGKLTGTVNTVRIEEGGRLVGDMFDGVGLVGGCRESGIEPTGKRILMLGAGGAARAIAFKLAEEKAASLTIWNRTESKAVELAAAVKAANPGFDVKAGPADATGHELVVQTTSLGLKEGDPMPMDPASLKPGMALFDIVAARDTELMAAARAAGLDKVVGGRPMILAQTMAQIEFLDAPLIKG